MVSPPSGSQRKRRTIQTKYRLPLLNWQVLASHQVTATVFGELDDERVLQVGLTPPTLRRPIRGLNNPPPVRVRTLQELDMDDFEEQFKTRAQPAPVDAGTLRVKLGPKTPSRVSLMEPNRAKNLAITLRKEGTAACDICAAIET